MTAPALADEVALAFRLGEVLCPPTRLSGLSAVDVWALDTVDGAWVVKLAEPAAPVDAMLRSGALERAAVTAGLPVPRPLTPAIEGNGYWAALPGGGYARVSERVPGAPPSVPADAEVAAWLGQTVAHLARLDLRWPVTAATYPVHDGAAWADRLAAAESAGVIDCPQRTTLAAAVAAATDLLRAALATAPQFRLSHRDISRPNILVTATGPMLLDFDHAGPEVPWWELVHHTFLLACVRLGFDEPSAPVIRTAVRAYAATGGPVGPADPTAFAGLLRGMLEWSAQAAHMPEASHVLPILLDRLPQWSTLLH